ncbi:MAG: MFS transporter [Ilumatobacteraceae bacterium]
MTKFPGWRVVAACFIALTTTAGLGFYGLAVYLNTFSREKGWEVSSVSLATTIFFLVSGASGLLVARLIARFDARWVIAGGGVIGAAALWSFGSVNEKWQLYLAYVVFAIGFSAAGLIPASTIVTRWFQTRRAYALSIASTGLSVGGIAITPWTKILLDRQGVEAAAPWLALIWVLGIVPVTVWLLKPDPAKEGWQPDGERIAPATAPLVVDGEQYSSAVKSRFFAFVTLAYVLTLGSQVGAIQQLVKLVEERTDKGAATLATTLLAATSVLARLVVGRIVDRVGTRRMSITLFVGQGMSLAWLAFADGKVVLLAGIVSLGLTIGNILMMQPLLIAERFGVRDYPRLFSRTQFYTTIGTAGGPFLLGWLRDNAGGYRTSYLIAAACTAAGVVVLRAAGPTTVKAS